VNRFLYTLLLRLLFPLLVVVLTIRGLRNPQVAIPWRQRLAYSRPPLPAHAPDPVWVHAVSLGEVQAAAALVAELRRRDPRRPVVFTVGTLTGMQRARAAFPAAAATGAVTGAVPGLLVLAYAPMDLPGAVRRFLDHFHPAALLLLEMEIWPNLLKACDVRGIPVAIASGRLSERSAQRYRRIGRVLILSALRRLRVIAAQSAEDAERFIALGAPAANVQVAGNLKFDFALPRELGARATRLRADLGERRAWVAGSTHAGEEAACIAAQQALERRFGADAPLLILVPRLTGRFEEVADFLGAQGVSYARRTQGAPPLIAGCRVLLVDTLGELMDFYACAEVAFVGGTLVPVGGHNLLEPAALGLALVCGPNTQNAPQVAQLLRESGALTVVADAAQLAEALLALFGNMETRIAAGEAGRVVVESNRGAVTRCLEIVSPVLPPPAQAPAEA
jgi:3-deoxy-D-manno-octulosonic-acid transferase